MYQGTFQVGENGKFLLFARTNNTATFLGLNTTRGRMELANGLSVSTNGSFCGTFIVGAPGCGLLTQTNTVSGNFTNAAHVAGNLKGAQKSNTGPYASAAGVYVGTYDGFDLGSIGSITVLICPDGTIGIYMINFATQVTNGQITTMGANGMLDLPLLRAHVQGTLNTLDNTITAEIHDSSEWPAIFFNLTRTEPLF